MTRRRELWFSARQKVEIREGAEPRALEPGEVLARALASGVSQGTELLLYRGEGPTPFDPSLDAPGTPTYPRRYGYAWVGEIAESAAEARPGTRVFALAPHGDQHILQGRDVRILPASIPAERATLAANLETAVTVMWDAEVSIGDNVTIVGGGVVGLLSGWLARRAGASRVRLVEPSPRRRRAGIALGIDEAISPENDDLLADEDVVIEATGDPASLDRAISHAARDATVVVASFYGERKSAVALGSAFHRRRVQLKASQVSHIPPRKTARWTSARRFGFVLELLEDARLDTLVDPTIPFDEAPAAYARLSADPGASVQTVFSYGTDRDADSRAHR
jgi:2-desacetyl-2-hydroxyethyl bacteriochlorophyllide A dehydrogenase